MLERNARDWGLTRDAMARGIANTRQTVALLAEGQLIREPVSIRAAERDNALEIELHYRGLPLFVPDLATQPVIN